MIINYKDVALLKSLMDGSATEEDIFFLNSQITQVEREYQEHMDMQKKLDEAVLNSLGNIRFASHGAGKTASEILDEVSRDLRANVSLPLITYSLRRLTAHNQVKRIYDKRVMGERINFYGKRYKPDVVFTLI